MKNALILVSGPSGSGKTTLVKQLIDRWPGCYRRPLSYTSRARRPGEDTHEYQFVSRQDILTMHASGQLANLDDVYGNLYAITRSSLDDVLANNISPIKEIHPANHYKLKSIYPQVVTVLLSQRASAADSVQRVSPRQSEDEQYYSSKNLPPFDLVLHPDRHNSIEEEVDFAHMAISATIATKQDYPSSVDIAEVNRLGYSRVAAEFSDEHRPTTAGFHFLSKDFFSSTIGLIPKNSTCLEIGPGQGWLRQAFEWPPVDYSSIDICREMLEAHAGPSDGRRLVGSAHALPHHSRTVDFIVCSLGDPYCYPSALVEMSRVLRKGGRLIMTAPSREWSEAIRHSSLPHMTSFQLKTGDTASVFSFTYNMVDLRQLLGLCGFQVVRYDAVTGSALVTRGLVPPAIEAAGRVLQRPLSELPIVNCVVAEVPS